MSDINFRRKSIRKKSFIIFFICISIISYFGFYTIFGNRGVLDYFSLKEELKEKNLIKNKLNIKIEEKENLVDRIQNDSLDIDLLDEQVRKNLGYGKDNEIVIYETDKELDNENEKSN